MSTYMERMAGRSLSAGSAFIEAVPPARYVWQKFQGTKHDNFVQLRWHFQPGSSKNGEQITPESAIRLLGPAWVTIAGVPEARKNHLGSYAGAVISASEIDISMTLTPKRQLAVAYRLANDDIMVGTNRRLNFLHHLAEDPERSGVIIGIGLADNTTAIGHAALNGTDFKPFPTIYHPDADQSQLMHV